MVKRVLTSIITLAVIMGSLVACGGSEELSKGEKSDLIILCSAVSDNRNCAEEAKIIGELISEKDLDRDCAQEEYLILIGDGGSELSRTDQIKIEELCGNSKRPALSEIATRVDNFIQANNRNGFYSERGGCNDFTITGKQIGLANALEWGQCNMMGMDTIRFFSYDASDNPNWRVDFILWAMSGEYGVDGWCLGISKVNYAIMTGTQFGLWSLDPYPSYGDVSVWEAWKGLADHLGTGTAYLLQYDCDRKTSAYVDTHEAGL